MDRSIISTCKEIIDVGDLPKLQAYYQFLEEPEDYRLPWEYIYQQVYLHACLRKQKEIAEWLQTLLETFGPVERIALRQMFSYGKYLLNK